MRKIEPQRCGRMRVHGRGIVWGIVVLLALLLMVGGASATVLFSDDFETGDFSKWTLAEYLVITTTDRNFSVTQDGIHIVASMTKGGLSIGQDFDASYWVQINDSSASRYVELAIEDSTYDGLIYIHLGIDGGSSWLAYLDNTYTLQYTYNNTIVLHNYIDESNWVKIGLEKIDNEIFLKINDKIFDSVLMVNSYPSIANNDLSILYIYVHNFATLVYYDDVSFNSQSPTTFAPSGYVNDSLGSVIAGVNVTLSNATASASNNSDVLGFWNVSGQLSDGLYNYSAQKTGYTTTTGNQTFTNGGNTLTNITLTALSSTVTPPTPINLSQTNDSASYVNWTWESGTGNVTDSFNVSVNESWTNGSADLFYNHTGLTYLSWSNISVFAFNSSGAGTLNETAITDSVQLPAALPTVVTLSYPIGWAYIAMNYSSKTLLELDTLFSTDTIQGFYGNVSKKYVSHRTGYAFNQNVSVIQKEGYYYYFSTATDITTTPGSTPSITLKTGWNIVGNYQTSARTLTELKTSIGATASSAKYYDRSSKTWVSADSQSVPAMEVFFVYVTSQTEWGG